MTRPREDKFVEPLNWKRLKTKPPPPNFPPGFKKPMSRFGVVEAQIGNGLDGYYVVRAPGDGSLVRSFTAGSETEAESFEPRPAAWERFWAVVDRLDVWGWAERYEPPTEVMDGTYWSIALDRSDRSALLGLERLPRRPRLPRLLPCRLPLGRG